MKSIITNAINWEQLGNHKVNDYEFTIQKSFFDKESRTLLVNISLNFIMPYFDVAKIKREILNVVPELSDVKFIFSYDDMILSPTEIVKDYIPYMVHSLRDKYPSLVNFIQQNNIELSNDVVTIYSLGKLVTDKLNEEVAPIFSHLLKEKFALNVNFEFINNEMDYKNIISNIKKEEEVVKQKIEQQENNIKEKKLTGLREEGKPPQKNAQAWSNRRSNMKKRERPAEGKRLYGEIINDEGIDFSQVSPEKGTVCIEGELFKIDSKLLKTGNYITTFILTNGKTSLRGKAFMGEGKLEELETLIKPGTPIKIKGTAQINTFDNQLEIMIEHINLGKEKEEKKETYDGTKKRVELHCHSKMSQLDGLNNPYRMVELAAQWDQEAIAITDHGVVQAYPDMDDASKKIEKLTGKKVKIIFGMEGYILDDEGLRQDDPAENPDDPVGNIDYTTRPVHHIIILARNQEGVKAIYKLVSDSHLKYFYRKPRIPWSLLNAYRENLIIGSACEAGEVYRAILNNSSEEELTKIASRYDYLEIEPLTNNKFMIDNGTVKDNEDLKNINRKIVALGDKLGKLVCATTDSHYENEESAIYRNIILAGMGYKDVENGTQGLYLRTTAEMLEEFSYLGDEVAKKVVIDNTNSISDLVENHVHPVPEGKFPPKIEHSEETLRETCYKTAHEKYGDPLPMEIEQRLEKELHSIIGNGYAVMYVSAQMLVNKSMEDGYLVGSRGSVGSSFAATMAGITEVNPLEPHYICPKCKHLEWGDPNKYDCGCDMPEKECPECGTKMDQEGYSIPFETFLGFTGNKEPDIDLNFAGEYQATAHKYVGKIFGEKNVYKAGTVGTVALKTGKMFARKYFEGKNMEVDSFEIERLATGCEGVRRTTGQHPGGIVILPENHDIMEFTPIQHPANDTKSDIITTHFDYHKIDKNLLKLDILGHDGPSMIRRLQDLTGISPFAIPFKDERVMSIFTSIDALGIKEPEEYIFHQGSLAIPEFGTNFTMQMLDDTQPSRFADLVRISGFSHGTDVWTHNAQDYIKSGQATMSEVISTRDDIMNYLILKGLPKPEAFQIMEKVRKGKGLTEEDEALMKEHEVPGWYIDSCNKIKYMFPRAHAAAYVMTSWRLAWFKVYYPQEFYATYLTTKVADFNIESAFLAVNDLKEYIENLHFKVGSKSASQKEKAQLIIDEVIYEMKSRGFNFAKPKLGFSDATKFTIDEEGVRIPFVALEGIGEGAALTLCSENEKKSYSTVEEIQRRGKINKTAIEVLRKYGVLEGLPESDQISMFSMIQ